MTNREEIKKKILLTGSSGFLGNILLQHWKQQHDVSTLGREPTNTFFYDLTNVLPALPLFDMVVHCAGKAHSIPKTPEEEQAFHHINFTGTCNLLNALQSNIPKSLVFISTVAVYGREEGIMLNEETALDGYSAYAKSKILAEQEVLAFGKTTGCNVLILRLPLAVGPQAPGNLGAMIKRISTGTYVRIGKGLTRRSMVLATDLAKYIPLWYFHKGIYNLTDGVHSSFAQLEEKIATHYNRKVKTLPLWLMKMVAKLGNYIPNFPLNTYRLNKLTATLTFSDLKAVEELNWKPTSVLESNFLHHE